MHSLHDDSDEVFEVEYYVRFNNVFYFHYEQFSLFLHIQ